MDKHATRLRRARKTRARIADLKMVRLCVFRSNNHIYAQVISAEGDKVLAQASTLEADPLSNTDSTNLTGLPSLPTTKPLCISCKSHRIHDYALKICTAIGVPRLGEIVLMPSFKSDLVRLYRRDETHNPTRSVRPARRSFALR